MVMKGGLVCVALKEGRRIGHPPPPGHNHHWLMVYLNGTPQLQLFLYERIAFPLVSILFLHRVPP